MPWSSVERVVFGNVSYTIKPPHKPQPTPSRSHFFSGVRPDFLPEAIPGSPVGAGGAGWAWGLVHRALCEACARESYYYILPALLSSLFAFLHSSSLVCAFPYRIIFCSFLQYVPSSAIIIILLQRCVHNMPRQKQSASVGVPV